MRNRIFLTRAACLLFVACTAAAGSQAEQQHAGTDFEAMLRHPDSGVMVVAHRGCWRVAPENSLRAIEECIRLGVAMVEIDVRRTRDGRLVAIHDETLERTTNGIGRIADSSFAEISALFLREGKGGAEARLTSERVPSLEQVLTTSRDRILVNLDVKEEALAEAWHVAEATGTAGQVLLKRRVRPFEAGRTRDHWRPQGAHFMPILRESEGGLGQQVLALEALQPVAFELIWQTEDALVQACAAAATLQARCWVNTMWDELSPGHSDTVAVSAPDQHWGHLVRLGANMLQTDWPEALLQYLHSRSPAPGE